MLDTDKFYTKINQSVYMVDLVRQGKLGSAGCGEKVAI